MPWTASEVPDQTGRTVIITGANTGIGYCTARVLAERGAQVILACRNEEKATAAVERIRATPRLAGSAEFHLVDLSSLTSVRAFASRQLADTPRLDLLVNNAGVMVPPAETTEDGFELQIGVNFLAHFALTGLLLPALRAAPSARIVTISSLAHRGGQIDLESFRKADNSYHAWREYQQSKLACLMFTIELARRLTDCGDSITSVAAHPGATKTDLQRHSKLFDLVASLGMSADKGALPSLMAAVDPSIQNGDYIGPRGIYEVWGYPARARIKARAHDQRVAHALWNAAQNHTGVTYLSA